MCWYVMVYNYIVEIFCMEVKWSRCHMQTFIDPYQLRMNLWNGMSVFVLLSFHLDVQEPVSFRQGMMVAAINICSFI